MPMNINGIPYNTDYMQYYRQTSHQVGLFIIFIFLNNFYIKLNI